MMRYPIVLILAVLAFACGQATPTPVPATIPATTTSSGLQYRDLVVGDGAQPTVGATAVVHYTGRLEDGTKFDSSVDKGVPFSFVVGRGNVIKGWDEGVLSMKVGGKRELTVPARLGYGDRGYPGVIPPGATLVFEVELLEVR